VTQTPAGGRLSFVILCMGRTGSTHLQFLLDSHPKVRCFGEWFTGNARSLDDVFISAPTDDPARFVNERVAKCTEPAVGFKLPLGSIRAHPQALTLLERPELSFIRLTRRNKLALFVSRRMLATTQVPQSTHGSYGETTIRLDPDHVRPALTKIEEGDSYLDGLVAGRPVYRLDYEELSDPGALEPLQEFLGVEPRPLSSVIERLRKRPLSETVENWDELEDALRGTRWEPLLVDDLG
jgi:hypothetical protein